MLAFLLMLLGAAYFSSLSTLETHFLLKSCAVLLPAQVGGTLYLLYLYWTGKLVGTARHQAQQRTSLLEKAGNPTRSARS